MNQAGPSEKSGSIGNPEAADGRGREGGRVSKRGAPVCCAYPELRAGKNKGPN